MDHDALDDVERVPHGGTNEPDVIDFSANTNRETPRGIAPIYDAALSASRRYPADDYGEFRTAASAYVGCTPAEVIPTAGAMDGIRLALSVLLEHGDSVLVPEPSFGEYAREVRLQGATPVGVGHDSIADADPAGHAAVIVCTPNNPTGETVETQDLLSLAKRCRETGSTLLVDEAFLDFTPRVSLAGEPGVVVARSLTKMFGLPGLRTGFLAASGRLRDRLDAARVTWGLTTPAADVGAYCLGCDSFVERTRERVDAERERVRERLSTRWSVYPSDAPFLLFDVGEDDPSAVLCDARKRGVVLRDARTFTRLDNHLRTAIRRPSENTTLLEALGV